MAAGVLESFPDLGEIVRVQGDAEVALSAVTGALGKLAPDADDSPLAVLTGSIAELDATLTIDVSGLTDDLPSALDALAGAVQPSVLEFVEDIESAYRAAEALLRDHPIARQAVSGKTIQEIALAVVQEALASFGEQLDSLAGNLLGTDALDAVRDGLAEIERFRAGFPQLADELPELLSRQLLGLAPDVLDSATARLRAMLAVLDPIDAGPLAAAVRSAQVALDGAVTTLVLAIDGLDPAIAGGYAAITAALDAVDDAVSAVASALDNCLRAVKAAVGGFDWADALSDLQSAMEAVDIGSIPTVDDVVDAIAGMLEDLLGQLGMVLDEDKLGDRVDVLTQGVDDMVAASGLSSARGAIEDALAEVRKAIEGIDLSVVQETVDDAMKSIREQLDTLHLDEVASTIESAFDTAERFATEHFTQGVLDDLLKSVKGLLAPVEALATASPLTDLTSLLAAATQQLGAVIDQLAGLLDEHLSEVEDLLAKLDDLSFKPIGDEVVAELDEIRKRLKAMGPAAMSDAERIAIRAALAALEALDVEDKLVAAAKDGFKTARDALGQVLAELTHMLDGVRGQLGVLDPKRAVAVVDEGLASIDKVVKQLSGAALVKPLRDEVAKIGDRLEALDPERLLLPLKAPYDKLMKSIARLGPKAWVEPLHALYAEIDRVIGLIDVTPVFDELDVRRRALLNEARERLLDAFAALDLPQPLAGLFDAIRPLLERATGALFDDGEGAARGAAADVMKGFDLTTPLKALDEPFDRLIAMAAEVPEQALLDAANTLRRTIGVALDALDPHALVDALRAGQGRLASLAPAAVAGPALGLGGLAATFTLRAAAAPPERAGDVAAVQAHLAASISLTAPQGPGSLLAPLTAAFEEVRAALAKQLAALDPAEATVAYGRLRESIDRLVPGFLRAPEPLSHAAVLAGLAGMRPSARAHRIEEPVRRFVARLRPLEAQFSDAVDRLFACVRRTLSLIDPLALKGAVASIYDAIREKAKVLDPAKLATSVGELFDELTAPLAALDPGELAEQLGKAFDRAVKAITAELLEFVDAVGKAIDAPLKTARLAVAKTLEDVRALVKKIVEDLKKVTERFEKLVFVELLERLDRVLDNLNESFDRELDRVVDAFDAMLAAIPGGSHAVTIG